MLLLKHQTFPVCPFFIEKYYKSIWNTQIPTTTELTIFKCNVTDQTLVNRNKKSLNFRKPKEGLNLTRKPLTESNKIKNVQTFVCCVYSTCIQFIKMIYKIKCLLFHWKTHHHFDTGFCCLGDNFKSLLIILLLCLLFKI